jgi:glutamate racemase
MAIGVFDSGVGGLTVLKALRAAMPHRDFLYLGDTARVPYGRKPPAMVSEFAREITRYLEDRGAEAVVVACNTATAMALPELQREFTGLPIWGVIEPGVEAAVRATRSGYVGVIGTNGAIRSEAYQTRLVARGLRVWAKACPLFVHLVEEGLSDSAEAELLARYYLADLATLPEIDTLILGCTHYPVLAPVLGRVLGPGIRLVESATVAAESVRTALGDGEEVGLGTITHFVTGDPLAYEHTAGVIGGVDGTIVAISVNELQTPLQGACP